MAPHRLPVALLLALLPALATAFSNLDRPRTSFLHDVLTADNSSSQKYCTPTGLIQDACCDFETVENVNVAVYKGLHDLVQTPYFRYHKVDLYRECPFWQEDGSCMNRACGVETTDEEHIPEPWRSHKLSEVKAVHDAFPSGGEEHTSVDDSAFCVVEGEDDHEGQYVDLVANPERFTGYAGESSSRVWKAIYEENCFTPVPFIDPSRSTSDGGSGFASLATFGGLGAGLNGGGWGEGEKKLLGSLAGPRDGGDEVCLEKRVFYRIVSGLHASISIHICDEYLDQATGEWSPNLDCFITRIATHPERLQNVYFAYVVALRALSKSGPQLLAALKETSADGGRAGAAYEKLRDLVDVANGCGSTFDEGSMFSGPESEMLKAEFKAHFRNVSRIMDCVGCDKCRLWGKLQVTGLGTALKLLFSEQHDGPSTDFLSRGELVPFVNVLHRLSESLAAVERFRQLWAEREAKKAVEAVVPQEKKTTPPVAVVQSPLSNPKASADAPPPPPPPTTTKALRPTPLLPNSKSTSSERARKVWEKLGTLCQESWRACWDLIVSAGGLAGQGVSVASGDEL